MTEITITPIPAFSDNYIWALDSANSESLCIVDPGDATPVLAFAETMRKPISAILITHHHYDHVGGVDTIKAKYPDATVYGPSQCQYQGIEVELNDAATCTVLGHEFEVIEVPGHTLDHIAYYCRCKCLKI